MVTGVDGSAASYAYVLIAFEEITLASALKRCVDVAFTEPIRPLPVGNGHWIARFVDCIWAGVCASNLDGFLPEKR